MPWGNRSLLFRDIDGNFINLFTPVSPQAIKKFAYYKISFLTMVCVILQRHLVMTQFQ